MNFKAPQMGVSSKIRVTFVDPRTGERVPAINTETGEEVWGGDWHPNMITDAGLDQLALVVANSELTARLTLSQGMQEIKESSGAVTASQSGTTVTSSGSFFMAQDVGRALVWADGSNARVIAYVSPTSVEVDKPQTVAAQAFERWHVGIETLPGAGATSTSGGNMTLGGGMDAANWYSTGSSWRQVELTSNANINGFGLGPSGGPNATIIECIRDASGNPVTVSLLEGKAVRVDHELVFTYPRSNKAAILQIDEYDSADQLMDSTLIHVDLWLRPGADTNSAMIENAMSVLYPSGIGFSSGPLSSWARFLGSRSYTPGEAANRGGGYTPSATDPTPSIGVYAPGSRRVTKQLTASASYAVGSIYGADFTRSYTGAGGAGGPGLTMQFQEGEPAFVKASTHTLSFGFEVSWDRDYSN